MQSLEEVQTGAGARSAARTRRRIAAILGAFAAWTWVDLHERALPALSLEELAERVPYAPWELESGYDRVSERELRAVRGVGTARARALVDERWLSGLDDAKIGLEDLERARGVGEKTARAVAEWLSEHGMPVARSSSRVPSPRSATSTEPGDVAPAAEAARLPAPDAGP